MEMMKRCRNSLVHLAVVLLAEEAVRPVGLIDQHLDLDGVGLVLVLIVEPQVCGPEDIVQPRSDLSLRPLPDLLRLSVHTDKAVVWWSEAIAVVALTDNVDIGELVLLEVEPSNEDVLLGDVVLGDGERSCREMVRGCWRDTFPPVLPS